MNWRLVAAKAAGIILSVVLPIGLVGCGGGGSGAPPSGTPPSPQPPPTVLTGQWYMQSSVDMQQCGEPDYLDAWAAEIMDNSGVLELVTSQGDTLSGTITGDAVSYSGTYIARNYDGTFLFSPTGFNLDSVTLTANASRNTMSGNITWTRPAGSVTTGCSGTAQVFASRNSAVAETEPNNDQANAQLLDLILNDNGIPQLSAAAFVSGSASSAGDEFDAFRIQLNNAALLEIELSHFDTATADLDLTLYDANLNDIAFSLSGSSWEYIVEELPAGTYYILVETFITTGTATYQLSVDVNP